VLRLCALLAIPGLLALAGPAAANAPQRDQKSYVESFTTSDLCGFPTTFTWVGTGYGTVFTDANGEFVRQTDHIRETLTVTSAGGDRWVDGKDAYAITQRADGTFTRVGLWFHLSGPGGGAVLRDVGRLVMTQDGDLVHLAGQHDWVQGNFAGLCNALSS
jgi:hypothetical protein